VKKTIFGIATILAFTIFILFFARNASAPSTQLQPNAPGQVNSSFDKQKYPINKPDSIWWIVSKVRPLNPITYAPSDLVVPKVPLRARSGDSEMRLRKEAAAALEEMVNAAQAVDIDLMLASGYRSYQLQVAVYNGNVQKYGQAGADKQSARPGTSEHQTGLAADLEPTTRQCEIEACFADLPEGKWLAVNAYTYGFVLRYVPGKEAITGYQYEPWHIRYIGKDLAAEMYTQNIQTLEEFFNVVPESQPY
jgi:zinc D-Ala-D-Ala carboxypeptidase